MPGGETIRSVLQSENHRLFGAAQPFRSFDDALQDRLQIKLGAADDAENFGSRRLLLQRFAQFGEQPRILDGDDGLSGKVRDQRDLLVGKGADFLAIERDCADKLIVLKHWYGEQRANAADLYAFNKKGIKFSVAALSRQIGDLRGRFGRHHPASRTFRAWAERFAAANFRISRWQITRSDEMEGLPVPTKDIAETGAANTRGILQHFCENRLEIAGRSRDDPQHFRSCGELLKRVVKLARTILPVGPRGIGRRLMNLLARFCRPARRAGGGGTPRRFAFSAFLSAPLHKALPGAVCATGKTKSYPLALNGARWRSRPLG